MKGWVQGRPGCWEAALGRAWGLEGHVGSPRGELGPSQGSRSLSPLPSPLILAADLDTCAEPSPHGRTLQVALPEPLCSRLRHLPLLLGTFWGWSREDSGWCGSRPATPGLGGG